MSTPPDEPQEPAAEESDSAETDSKSHAVRNIVLIVAGLFVAAVAGFLIAKSGQPPPTGAVSATSEALATSSPSPPPPSPSPLHPSASPQPPSPSSHPSPTQSPSPSPSPSSSPSPSPHASPSPSPSPWAPPSPTVLVDFEGAGDATSDRFTAPSQWKLSYSFQCAAGEGPGITVDLTQAGKVLKSLVNDAGVDEARVVLVDVGGTDVELVVQTQCTWQVTGTA